MPTMKQLIRNTRQPIRNVTKSPALRGCPQRSTAFSTATVKNVCREMSASALRASRARPCCCFWMTRASAHPPDLPAPPAPWIPAMCFWLWADPTRSPMDLCAWASLPKIPRPRSITPCKRWRKPSTISEASLPYGGICWLENLNL